MSKWAYYNEWDEKKAAWIRELIRRGVVTDGEVDTRSIADVQPDDLRGFRRVHMFAGIAVWDYALGLAGVANEEVWTGSCPCTPFSQAGKRKGTQDERHLWPAWFRLIAARKPQRIFGEQVSSRDGLAWFDHVRSDLDQEGYETGVVDLCAAGFGAPHLRQRLYFVGNSAELRRRWRRLGDGSGTESERRDSSVRCADWNGSAPSGSAGVVAESNGSRHEGNVLHAVQRSREGTWPDAARGSARGMAHTDWQGLEGHGRPERIECAEGREEQTGRCAESGSAGGMAHTADGPVPEPLRRSEERDGAGQGGEVCGATRGFWASAEWVWCRDGKYRPVERAPEWLDDGTAADLGCVRLGSRKVFFPLQKGGKARILRLRGYGDAIVAPVAAEFIKACMEYRHETL